MRDLTGTSIENYHLNKLLYEEGIVQVYVGTHTNLKKVQTIYMIHHADLETPSVYVEELLENAQAAAQLDSQLGLIRVQDVDEIGGRYYATDHVPGPTLEELFQSLSRVHRYLAITDVVRIMDRSVRALEHAYIKGRLFVSLQPHTIRFRQDPHTPTEQSYLSFLTDMGITPADARDPDMSQRHSQQLLRSAGFLLYSLLTNITAIDKDAPLDFSPVAKSIETLSLAQADSMMQLLDKLIVSPAEDVTQGVTQLLKELEPFQFLQIPGRVPLSEVYTHVLDSQGGEADPGEIGSYQPSVDQEGQFSSGQPTPDENTNKDLERVNSSLLSQGDGLRVDEGVNAPGSSISEKFLHDGGHTSAYRIQVIGPDISFERQVHQVPVFVGRAAQNDIRISDPRASRQHLKIEQHNGGLFITDLKSTNGTRLDGQTIPQDVAQPCLPGQVIQIGRYQLQISRVEDFGEPLPPRHILSLESLIIPSVIHINALRQEIPIDQFIFLSNKRMLAFYVPTDENYQVEPGQVITISVYLVSFVRGETHKVTLAAGGIPKEWFDWPDAQTASDGQTMEHTFSLRGNEQKQVDIAIAPVREWTSRAGKYRLDISLTQDGQEEATYQEIPLQIEGYSDFRWSVSPEEHTGAEVVIQVSILNLGNRRKEKMTLSCWEGNNATDLTLEPQMTDLEMTPGEKTELEIHVSPKKRVLIGRNKIHQIVVQLTTQGPGHTHSVMFVEKGRLSLG